LDVRPRRVLRQNRADDDFKLRFSRPPVLRSEGGEERIVVFVQWGCGCLSTLSWFGDTGDVYARRCERFGLRNRIKGRFCGGSHGFHTIKAAGAQSQAVCGFFATRCGFPSQASPSGGKPRNPLPAAALGWPCERFT